MHVASESVFSSVFSGITSRLVPLQIQHNFLQSRKTNGIWQQRILRNKQFSIHVKKGINERYYVRVAFVEKVMAS